MIVRPAFTIEEEAVNATEVVSRLRIADEIKSVFLMFAPARYVTSKNAGRPSDPRGDPPCDSDKGLALREAGGVHVQAVGGDGAGLRGIAFLAGGVILLQQDFQNRGVLSRAGVDDFNAFRFQHHLAV